MKIKIHFEREETKSIPLNVNRSKNKRSGIREKDRPETGLAW